MCYFVRDLFVQMSTVRNYAKLMWVVKLLTEILITILKIFILQMFFSTDNLEMFLKDSVVWVMLDVIFQKSWYLELVSLSDNCCMFFFKSCNNPSAVFVVFSEVLLNNLFGFVECFKRYKVRGAIQSYKSYMQ